MCFYFFGTVQVDTVYQKVLTTHACFCFYVMEFRKPKNVFSEASTAWKVPKYGVISGPVFSAVFIVIYSKK